MAVTLVQSAKAHTTADGATSIAPTFGTATTAGNLLVLMVGQGLSSIPTSWSEVPNDYGVLAVCYYPNNPGGITDVTCTLVGITAGTIAILAEFQNASRAIDAFGNTRKNNDNIITQNPAALGELYIAALYDDGNSSAVLNTIGDWTLIQTDTSTGSTTNVSGWLYYLTNTISRPSGFVSGANHPALVYERFAAAPPGAPIVYDSVGGAEGIYVPRYYQGSIGG